MLATKSQPVTGLVPPQRAEAIIREVWPSVAAWPGAANLGRALIKSIVAAPLGWLILAPFYFLKILPFRATRYTLSNRRLMIRRGLQPQPVEEVALAAIDDVRQVLDGNSKFFRAGTLEVISQGKVVLTLPGVPEPESFRHNVVDACAAWVPGKPKGPFVPAKAAAPS
jgi:hypothetical protein